MNERAHRRGPAPTKHNDILWVAARLFSERGVAAVSTREIARAAQTTERTLFKHYGSKDALARAVIAEAVLPHLTPTSLTELRQAIEAHGGELEAWHRALLERRLRALSEAPELTRLLLAEIVRDEALRARFAEQWRAAFWTPLTCLFERLQCEGKLRHDLPVDALARSFLSLNLGFLLGRIVLAPQLSWDEPGEIDAVVKLFARGASA